MAPTTSNATRTPTKRRLRVLGPAFVAAIAYVDPGNFATNLAAGSQFGYQLAWVVVASSLTAMLLQYLSAKFGVATAASLPALCAREFHRRWSIGLWLQGEAVAIATDLAEIVGGAVALHLLFDLPLFPAGCAIAVVSTALLAVRSRTQRGFEAVIGALLLVVLLAFVYALAVGGWDPASAASGLIPRLQDADALPIAIGIVGATAMPHAISLHGALTRDRMAISPGLSRRSAMRAQRIDITVAMTLAGLTNLLMLVVAAATLGGQGLPIESITQAHRAWGELLGPLAALLFAVALLASGLASSSVGTLAGQVAMEGLLGRRIPILARRAITVTPALALLAVGVDPTQALIASQIVLSFCIPFTVVPLILLTRRPDLMGDLVNRRGTTAVASAAAVLIIAFNVALLAQL